MLQVEQVGVLVAASPSSCPSRPTAYVTQEFNGVDGVYSTCQLLNDGNVFGMFISTTDKILSTFQYRDLPCN